MFEAGATQAAIAKALRCSARTLTKYFGHRLKGRLEAEEVEFATLEWVDWFNQRRLLGR